MKNREWYIHFLLGMHFRIALSWKLYEEMRISINSGVYLYNFCPWLRGQNGKYSNPGYSVLPYSPAKEAL